MHATTEGQNENFIPFLSVLEILKNLDGYEALSFVLPYVVLGAS